MKTSEERPITPQEEAMIAEEFEALLRDYAHTRNGDKADLIRRVFEFAKQAHGCKRRLSGRPYICHPLAVARIVCNDLGLGSTSISGALLHDVVSATDVTFDDIEREFGARITGLVRGLTKISGGNLRFATDTTGDPTHHTVKDPETQAENFRNLLLTISEDVRVILIKIADRLHNMRTLDALEPQTQHRIADETLYLYAPIAYRLGLFNIKSELEDLSLKYEHPDEYARLKQQLQEQEEGMQRIFATFSAPIVSMLDDLGLKYSFKYRMKSIYSIWRKMKTKNVPFEEVYDLFAARIVFQPESEATEKTDCWRIYNAITSVYKLHPDRIRDWISRPKSNGYEALHVTVMGPDGNWIEIQIRSERMNEIAEKGLAAHWKYKRGKAAEGDPGLDKWMKNIKEILDNPAPNALDFLDSINLNLLSTEIYLFTPGGDLQELPKGATALDFAFALHTDIGLRAEAARINHQLMPLSTILTNGQQVEIITANEERVSEEWRNWVTTPKARTKIQAVLNRRKQIIIDRGELRLKQYCTDHEIVLDQQTIDSLLHYYKLPKRSDLYQGIGTGTIVLDETTRKHIRPVKRNPILGFFGFGKGRNTQQAVSTEEPSAPATPEEHEHVTKRRKQLHLGLHFNLTGKQPAEELPKPIVPTAAHNTTLELTGIDGRGLLNTITRVISETITANILNVHLECKDGIFKGYLTLGNTTEQEVNKLCVELKKIHEVERAVTIR
jgi:GTP pyrophosphokinase